MDKSDKSTQNFDKEGAASKGKLNSKKGESFVQNPDQNNQIHKASLGPNTKR